MSKKSRKPLTGVAFDIEQTNLVGNVAHYLRELDYYGARRFAALIKDGRNIESDLERIEAGKNSKHYTAGEDVYQAAHEWMDDCDSALSDYARDVMRHDYIYFGVENGAAGFFYSVESALEDSERFDAGDSVPRGFSGLAAFVTDHGNVTVQSYSRGRMTRELFSVV